MSSIDCGRMIRSTRVAFNCDCTSLTTTPALSAAETACGAVNPASAVQLAVVFSHWRRDNILNSPQGSGAAFIRELDLVAAGGDQDGNRIYHGPSEQQGKTPQVRHMWRFIHLAGWRRTPVFVTQKSSNLKLPNPWGIKSSKFFRAAVGQFAKREKSPCPKTVQTARCSIPGSRAQFASTALLSS
jgi:hypothetical protein